MALLRTNTRQWNRRRRLGLGDGDGDFGGGTVSVSDLQQQNQAGLFNALQTPGTGPGSDVESSLNPTGSGQAYRVGNAQPLTSGVIIKNASGGYTIPGGYLSNYGWYGPLTPNINIPDLNYQPGSTATASSSSVSAAGESNLWNSLLALLETPIYSGSSITWGWAVIGTLIAWLLLRR